MVDKNESSSSSSSELMSTTVCALSICDRIHQMQVMSESVASALQFVDSDATEQTRLFIWMMDKFFDLLNVKGPQMAKLKRKDTIAPYTSPVDERFKVCMYKAIICV